MESLAVQGEAFAGVFSITAEQPSPSAATPAGQPLPQLISLHLGRDFLTLWEMGGVQ